jgi:hypothetical protein
LSKLKTKKLKMQQLKNDKLFNEWMKYYAKNRMMHPSEKIFMSKLYSNKNKKPPLKK